MTAVLKLSEVLLLSEGEGSRPQDGQTE